MSANYTSDLDMNSIPLGFKGVVELSINSHDMNELNIPLFVIKGSKPGKTIGVLGGVHGDEYDGPQAIRDLYDKLEPNQLTGTFLGVPHSNPPAFSTGTRVSPVDGLNLARVFPGTNNGSITEKIADCLGSNVIRHVDFFIDLHSSGSYISMPLLIGYYSGSNQIGQESKNAALNFGTDVVWGHPEISAGRTISYAHDLGIPWLYAECPGGGWLDLYHVEKYVSGVRNVMKMLGIISFSAGKFVPKHYLIGSGDIDKSITTTTTGYLLPKVDLLQKVQKDQILAKIIDLSGKEIETIKANMTGVVICIRKTPSVNPDTLAFLITGTENLVPDP